VRETFWASLGEAAEHLGCERSDLLALLIENGMLLGGFSEAEGEGFVARLEQINDAFERHIATHPQPAAEPQQGPVLPPLPGTGPEIDHRMIGRLAMRTVEDHWVAYYAMPGTMEGAIELGRIRMGLIEREERRQEFVNVMSNVVADIIERTAGKRPTMVQVPPAGTRSH
jgi:hypothetical protein